MEVMINTFKRFMARVTDSLLQQVTNQVKRVIEETKFGHPLPSIVDTQLPIP